MRITAGIDVGSTYTKAVVLDSERRILGRQLEPTGFKLDEVAENALAQALAAAGVDRSEVEYVVSTGFGRHQMASADTQVTDLTASARGAMFLFPGTRTVLDVGGQTMNGSAQAFHKVESPQYGPDWSMRFQLQLVFQK